MVEVREVLRAWLEGHGLRRVAERAGVDRKTARRYVAAAEAAGLSRDAGTEALTDELIGVVVEAVRPARPNGHGAAWQLLLGHEEQIRAWVAGSGGGQEPLSIVKIEELLARRGVRVPYRTLHRFAAERCGFRARSTTVRVVDGEPGVECQLDFAQLGLLDYINARMLGSTNDRVVGQDIHSLFTNTGDYASAGALSVIVMGVIVVMTLLYIRRVGTEELL